MKPVYFHHQNTVPTENNWGILTSWGHVGIEHPAAAPYQIRAPYPTTLSIDLPGVLPLQHYLPSLGPLQQFSHVDLSEYASFLTGIREISFKLITMVHE